LPIEMPVKNVTETEPMFAGFGGLEGRTIRFPKR